MFRDMIEKEDVAKKAEKQQPVRPETKTEAKRKTILGAILRFLRSEKKMRAK